MFICGLQIFCDWGKDEEDALPLRGEGMVDILATKYTDEAKRTMGQR